eukprot:6290850-Prymnesium_polylepis.2
MPLAGARCPALRAVGSLSGSLDPSCPEGKCRGRSAHAICTTGVLAEMLSNLVRRKHRGNVRKGFGALR